MPPAPLPDPSALLSQASARLRAGRPADALPYLAEAARLRPNDAAILHDFGLACLACGQVGQAVTALRRAIAARPRFSGAHLRLGIALEAAGAPEEALAAYRRAGEITPALADAPYRAGELLDNLGRLREAGEAFGRAAAAAPGTVQGRMASARARLAENRDGEAEATLRRVLAAEPDQAAALELLGQVLAEAGRFDEAREMLLRAIARAPLRAGAYYDVVRCGRIGAADGDLITRMHAAATLPGLDPMQRARVHLALGKAADDLGGFEEAMAHFDAAQTLRDPLTSFDGAAFDVHVARLIGAALPDAAAGAALAGRDTPRPLVIVGLPRSGTTLVEQILSAHRQVGAAGELGFWNARGPEWLAAPGAAFLARARIDYLRVLREAAPGAAYVTDKMPLNFQWAGLIHAALPHAIIIHCRRAPIASALSIHQTHFSPRMPMPTGGAVLVGYVRAYLRLCAHWRAVLPAHRFVDIDYEVLVGTPEPAIRRLLRACGLAWDDACLHPERNRRVVKTASKWQARQPINGTGLARWRGYEPYLGPLRPLIDENVTGGLTPAATGPTQD